jgi:hypothetical protein
MRHRLTWRIVFILLGAFAFLSAACMVVSTGKPAYSQGSDNPSLRAVNTARMRAEAINGGLGVYRTATCMHMQSGGECLTARLTEGFLFRFFGGVPGWQQYGKAPSVETEILVSTDGRTVVRVFYNGPPR